MLNGLCCFSQEHSAKVMKLFADIFGWLPLATVVNNKILVTHGGISNITDLSVIDKIDRHKVSALNHFFDLLSLSIFNLCSEGLVIPNWS